MLNFLRSNPTATADHAGQVHAASAAVAGHASALADAADALRALFRPLAPDMSADDFESFDGLMAKLAKDSRGLVAQFGSPDLGQHVRRIQAAAGRKGKVGQ